MCFTTTGPGAIHLLNGLYDAKGDQMPVLAIKQRAAGARGSRAGGLADVDVLPILDAHDASRKSRALRRCTKDDGLIFFYGLPRDAAVAQKTPTTPGWEVYDLRNDLEEMNNVYADSRTRIVTELKTELLRLKTNSPTPMKSFPSS